MRQKIINGVISQIEKLEYRLSSSEQGETDAGIIFGHQRSCIWQCFPSTDRKSLPRCLARGSRFHLQLDPFVILRPIIAVDVVKPRVIDMVLIMQRVYAM